MPRAVANPMGSESFQELLRGKEVQPVLRGYLSLFLELLVPLKRELGFCYGS